MSDAKEREELFWVLSRIATPEVSRSVRKLIESAKREGATEAADEIERLRAAARSWLKVEGEYQEDARADHAEIERLRAGLRELIEQWKQYPGEADWPPLARLLGEEK